MNENHEGEQTGHQLIDDTEACQKARESSEDYKSKELNQSADPVKGYENSVTEGFSSLDNLLFDVIFDFIVLDLISSPAISWKYIKLGHKSTQLTHINLATCLFCKSLRLEYIFDQFINLHFSVSFFLLVVSLQVIVNLSISHGVKNCAFFEVSWQFVILCVVR